VANSTDLPLSTVVTVEGLGYTPTVAEDYFTGAVRAPVVGGRIALSLPANGTLALRLR
jgi:hypothetical protein